MNPNFLTENFNSSHKPHKPITDKNEYIKDIRYIASYVGDYVGTIYYDKRNQLYDSSSSTSAPPIDWQPRDENDPILQQDTNNMFAKARSVVKAYLDSAFIWISGKYDTLLLNEMAHQFNIRYNVNNNGIMTITFVSFGNSRKYYI